MTNQLGKLYSIGLLGFTAIADFKDGLPTGEFSYHFPIALAKLNGKASIVGNSKIQVEGHIWFPTLSFEVKGLADNKIERVEFEY